MSAELREKRGPVLKFSFKVAPDEALEIPEFLVASCIGTASRTHRPKAATGDTEPLLASTDASYAALAAEADRRFNAKEYPPGIVLYRKAIELRPRE